MNSLQAAVAAIRLHREIGAAVAIIHRYHSGRYDVVAYANVYVGPAALCNYDAITRIV